MQPSEEGLFCHLEPTWRIKSYVFLHQNTEKVPDGLSRKIPAARTRCSDFPARRPKSCTDVIHPALLMLDSTVSNTFSICSEEFRVNTWQIAYVLTSAWNSFPLVFPQHKSICLDKNSGWIISIDLIELHPLIKSCYVCNYTHFSHLGQLGLFNVSEVVSVYWEEIKPSINLLGPVIDRSISIASGRESERNNREQVLFIGDAAGRDRDVRLVAITRPLWQSDASLPCLLSSSSAPLRGQQTPLHACSCVRTAENVSMYVWCYRVWLPTCEVHS